MSYLDESVTEISTGAGDGCGFFHVAETDAVELSTRLDAQKYAARFYKKDRGYEGPVCSVAEERPDGYVVVVMVESTVDV